MKKSKNLVIVSLLVSLLVSGVGALAAAPTADDSPALLYPAAAEPARLPARPTVLRSRLVEVNTGLLTTAAPTLRLDLFDDLSLTVERDRVETGAAGALSWVGRVAGQPDSQVYLSLVDNVVAGTINTAESSILLRPAADGAYLLEEIDRQALPAESDALTVDLPAATRATTTSADDGSLIDILVVYTDDVRAALGGTAAAEALVSSMITQINDGYARSQVAHRVRLVQAAEVSYQESGSALTDLLRLQDPADGYLDQVHQLRDQVQADLVTMLVKSMSGSCGIAYLMGSVSATFAPYAFSVVQWECGSTNLSLAHETGHNLGAQHDIDNASMPGAYPYAYGYQAPDNSFRTIMAYNCDGSYCPRVNNWSNPAVTYNGRPTGVANLADNHLALNNTAYTVSNFRLSLPGEPTLAINYTSGSPGSVFTLQAANFPGDQSTTVLVNSVPLTGGSRTSDGGDLVFELTTDQADEGPYLVTLMAGDQSASAVFRLDDVAPLREPTNTGIVLDVPAGIALGNNLFLPSVVR